MKYSEKWVLPLLKKRPLEEIFSKLAKREVGSIANIAYIVDKNLNIALIGSSLTIHKNEWILFSYSTYHICPNMEFFSSLEEYECVYKRNDTPCSTKGIDKARLQMYNETVMDLKDLRYVLYMKKFISLRVRVDERLHTS